MNAYVGHSWRYLLALAVALILLATALTTSQTEAGAAPAARNVFGYEVDTEMNRGNAAPGGNGGALVSILVTSSRTQKPNSNVAASIPLNNAGITLPARVAMKTLTVAPGGCAVTPTQLINQGDGVYTIRFVPSVNNAACKWLSGDYLYVVIIKNAAGKVMGEGLAKLSL